MKEPEPVEMTPEQIHDLRIALLGQAELVTSQREVLIGLLDNHLWLQFELQEAKLSIHRLKMVFGIKSEKKRSSTSDQTSQPIEDSDNAQQPSEPQLSSPEESRSPNPRNRKGIGRRSADEYTGADIIHVEHSELSRGDYCPDELCDGKVYLKKRPGKVVRVSGNTMFAATVYHRDIYECNLCKSVYPAALPEGVSETSKYDTKAKVIAAANRIQMGIAMYRMAMWQEQLGIPMPEGTQWMLIREVYEALLPIFECLFKMAAQYSLFYVDDTWVRILEIIDHNKKAKTKAEKKGAHTTGLIAVEGERKIILYFSGTKHAGQNLTALLDERNTTLPAPIQMNDALSCNGITEGTIECNCTSHGRRKFVEIEHLFPLECNTVIDAIASVYKNDDHCKKNNLSPIDRLTYHQKHSKQIMDDLKLYMQQKMDNKEVEPNSSLGKAFTYWLKRWDKMTRYLTVAGAPIDNNFVEQGLKRIILFRKNCLFHKTVNSAMITSRIASIIATSIEAGINPLDYMEALVDNQNQVVKEPECWLPWNYQEQLNTQKAA